MSSPKWPSINPLPPQCSLSDQGAALRCIAADIHETMLSAQTPSWDGFPELFRCLLVRITEFCDKVTVRTSVTETKEEIADPGDDDEVVASPRTSRNSVVTVCPWLRVFRERPFEPSDNPYYQRCQNVGRAMYPAVEVPRFQREPGVRHEVHADWIRVRPDSHFQEMVKLLSLGAAEDKIHAAIRKATRESPSPAAHSLDIASRNERTRVTRLGNGDVDIYADADLADLRGCHFVWLRRVFGPGSRLIHPYCKVLVPGVPEGLCPLTTQAERRAVERQLVRDNAGRGGFFRLDDDLGPATDLVRGNKTPAHLSKAVLVHVRDPASAQYLRDNGIIYRGVPYVCSIIGDGEPPDGLGVCHTCWPLVHHPRGCYVSNTICENCGSIGHTRKQCPNPTSRLKVSTRVATTSKRRVRRRRSTSSLEEELQISSPTPAPKRRRSLSSDDLCDNGPSCRARVLGE